VLREPNDPWQENEIQFFWNLVIPLSAEFTLWSDFVFKGRIELPLDITRNAVVMGIWVDDAIESLRHTEYPRIRGGGVRLVDFIHLSSDVRRFRKILVEERNIDARDIKRYLLEPDNARVLFESYRSNIRRMPLAKRLPKVIEGRFLEVQNLISAVKLGFVLEKSIDNIRSEANELVRAWNLPEAAEAAYAG
jgi:hypothetical protein